MVHFKADDHSIPNDLTMTTPVSCSFYISYNSLFFERPLSFIQNKLWILNFLVPVIGIFDLVGQEKHNL